MKVWVDADACPNPIKEILFRAANRVQIPVTLIANHSMRIPPSRHIRLQLVPSGFDMADEEIERLVEPGDLVITSDIPLASAVIDKGALALSPRGELMSSENIRARLNIRDFMDTMRSSGVDTGGPPAMTQSERQAFANQLDRLLHLGTR